jgi:hypothetical protein
MAVGQTYTFNIVNLAKSDSLFLRGMQPVGFSSKAAAKDGAGWSRVGTGLAYFPSSLRAPLYRASDFTFSFSFAPAHTDDDVYFAYSVPYSYSDLQADIAALLAAPSAERRVRHRMLCQTIAGNACPLLTISSFDGNPAAMATRPAVVITARVHPGETPASWMAKGLIDFLVSDDPDAEVRMMMTRRSGLTRRRRRREIEVKEIEGRINNR